MDSFCLKKTRGSVFYLGLLTLWGLFIITPNVAAQQANRVTPRGPAGIQRSVNQPTGPQRVTDNFGTGVSIAGIPAADLLSNGAEGPEGTILPSGLTSPEQWTTPEGLTSSLKVMLMLTVVSLAPAILLMTTSFVRIIVVLGLLRQAIGTQQLPPSQVITSIALFMTVLLMTPVWTQTYEQGIKPYTNHEIGLEEAFDRGVDPIRRFMALQINRTENLEDVFLFLDYLPSAQDASTGEVKDNYVLFDPQEGEELVPLQALVPAYMLSELKTSFLIGFRIYLPFLILDIIVASITISMGMLMLPPVLISMPFKLLLFVLVDGWRLVVEMLLESFQVLV